MHQGNWSCSSCNKAITELPFEPNRTDGLLCIDCFKNKNSGGGTQGEKKMFEGDWKCGTCGAEIKKLPFQPRETGNLKCLDCYKNK
ncbi:MAG: hypothetical protein QF858_03670 [Candidatus Pacebacteria bacterium]|jgi:CxxC-x17-CxxC domain-containing protein|nr:hypothetical protein [bacterium]MDP6527943.1 hypothetical protein [Candidatus Paceibacterota bacterium]|tara:strand:+ start:4955 stop:5212 length:258 start_codon:yes stop_codon:yes gene_type:complete